MNRPFPGTTGYRLQDDNTKTQNSPTSDDIMAWRHVYLVMFPPVWSWVRRKHIASYEGDKYSEILQSDSISITYTLTIWTFNTSVRCRAGLLHSCSKGSKPYLPPTFTSLHLSSLTRHLWFCDCFLSPSPSPKTDFTQQAACNLVVTEQGKFQLFTYFWTRFCHTQWSHMYLY